MDLLPLLENISDPSFRASLVLLNPQEKEEGGGEESTLHSITIFEPMLDPSSGVCDFKHRGGSEREKGWKNNKNPLKLT